MYSKQESNAQNNNKIPSKIIVSLIIQIVAYDVDFRHCFEQETMSGIAVSLCGPSNVEINEHQKEIQ